MRESAENYLETVLILRERYTRVRSIDIANTLGISKPTVSIAMKQLREDGYVTSDDDGFVVLTEDGEKIASSVYERHRTLTKFLTLLGVSGETASADACKIEHDISDESYDAIKQYCTKAGL